jgi:hypothetical protein
VDDFRQQRDRIAAQVREQALEPQTLLLSSYSDLYLSRAHRVRRSSRRVLPPQLDEQKERARRSVPAESRQKLEREPNRQLDIARPAAAHKRITNPHIRRCGDRQQALPIRAAAHEQRRIRRSAFRISRMWRHQTVRL